MEGHKTIVKIRESLDSDLDPSTTMGLRKEEFQDLPTVGLGHNAVANDLRSVLISLSVDV